MIRHLVQLNLWTLKNRILSRIRRLKQVRYLVGFVVAVAYFSFFVRPWRGASMELRFTSGLELSDQILAAIQGGVALLLTMLAALPWIWPGSRGALSLTPSEISFLFPAPLTRKQIVDYHLLKTQAGTIFSSLIVTFFGARLVAPNAVQGFICVWLLFTAINLYVLGVGIVRANLVSHGASGLKRMAVPALVLAAVAASLVWGWLSGSIRLPTSADLQEPVEWFLAVTGSAPLKWLLLPSRTLLLPIFARTTGGLILALAPVLIILGGLYLWVVRSDHDYQEASAEAARRRQRSRHRERKTGEFRLGGRVRSRRAPYALTERTSLLGALVWRSLVAAWRIVDWPIIYRVVGGLAGAAWIYAAFIHQPAYIKPAMGISIVASLFAGMMLLMGTEMVRTDLRMDLLSIDNFKMLPISGTAYILSVTLAGATIITVLQMLLMLLAFPLAALAWDFRAGELALMGVSALMIIGPLNLLMSLVHNAALLTFPSWHQLGLAQARGMDNFGQTMVSMIFRLASFALVILPLAAIGAGIVFLTYQALGAYAFLITAAVLWVPISVEIWIGLKLLGNLFERFDPSKELDQITS